MKFCPKCKSIMFPKKEGDKIVWICRKCGYREEESAKKNELVVKTEINDRKGIPVIDVEAQKKQLPTVEVECPKCGYNKAIFWLRQTRAADEPPTRFFKCLRCGHVWREYA